MITLKNALVEKLQVLLDTEQQLAELLPTLAKASSNPELREAFESQAGDAHEQIARLHEILQALGQDAFPLACECADKLIAKSASALDEQADEDVRDALLIASVQSIVYHEMALYGSTRMWALLQGHDVIADLLEQTLTEKELMDETLYELSHAKMFHEAQEAMAA